MSEFSKLSKDDIQELAKQEIEFAHDKLGGSQKGLSDSDVRDHQNKYGKNVMSRKKKRPIIFKFFEQFTHFMAILLILAGFAAYFTHSKEIAYASWIVVIVNALFSFMQEVRADKAMDVLLSMVPNRVKVIRDGVISEIDGKELTVGDTLHLVAGDNVPADIRIISAQECMVDNSMLTGESVSVERNTEVFNQEDKPYTEAKNLAFAGTTVVQGNMDGIVYAIGDNTQLGDVSKMTQSIKKGKSTLDEELNYTVRRITVIAFLFALVAFVGSTFLLKLDIKYGFIFAIGILVANIPEGLLPSVSLSLAMSVQRMSKKNALVRKLDAVETLSATTVICTDKTGTLTQNKQTVHVVWTPDGYLALDKNKKGKHDFGKEATSDKDHRRLLKFATLCSDAHVTFANFSPSKEKMYNGIGNPNEIAILTAAEKLDIDSEAVREQVERLETIPFNSDRKMMSVTYLAKKNNKHTTVSKGAPNKILNRCAFYIQDGKPHPMTEEKKAEFLEINESFARNGYRVLAVSVQEERDADTVFLGMVTLFDPPREGVKEAIQSCYDAGIRVTVITGDYGVTAEAICRQIGVIKDNDDFLSLTGNEVEAMSDEELQNVLRQNKPTIFSRTVPQHKYKIVEAYKAIGEIVAVTGDGVNDVLALKSANIGIAMGKSGSDVTREVADVILLDDSFTTIVTAIEQGRAIYQNIKKFLTYILASNMAEVIPYFLMVFFNMPLALTVLQILAIDLGTDLLPALALGMEEPEPGILHQAPRKLDEHLLNSKLILRAYFFLGLIEAVLSLAAFFFIWMGVNGYSLAELRTLGDVIATGNVSAQVMSIYVYSTAITLAMVIACQIGNVFACKSETVSIFKSKISKVMKIALVSEVVVALLIFYFPPFQNVFGVTSIEFGHLWMLFLAPIVLLGLEELRKLIVRKNKASKIIVTK